MRISKNDIFLNPEKYSGLTDFKRIYMSENLCRQIQYFLTMDKDHKNLHRLLKMASDLGFKPMNLVLASYDGSTAVCEIKTDMISVSLWKNYRENENMFFTTHKDDKGELKVLKVKTQHDLQVCYGFQVFLYFLLFIDVGKKELKPKERHIPKKYDSIKNDTGVSFTVADVNWGFEINRDTPFSVSGHYRLQRYGPGRQNAKLIYIEPFEKHGFHKRAGKDRFEED